MKNKSIVAMLAMLAVSVSSVFAIPASAAPEQDSFVDTPVSPQYTHAFSVGSTLSITNGTAYCHSDGYGKSNVKSMNCMQYLEKKNLLGNWSITVNNWFQTSSGSAISMYNTQSGLGSGTYRLRSVFTFYAVGGYEEVTAYSYEIKN